MSENNVPKKRGRKPKNKNTEIIQVNNQPQVKTISLAKADNTQDILNAISNGETVELDVDKQVLLNNFNTFMLTEAYSQLPTIIKLYELQTKCLDKYYEQVNEMLDNDDVNVFLLDKIITTINSSIDRCNNIILKLGLNSDITDQLMIKHVDNSQNINVFQSQISKQKVLDTVQHLFKSGIDIENINDAKIESND